MGSACVNWNNNECIGTGECPPRCPRFFDRDGDPILIQPFESEFTESLIAMYEALGASNRTTGLPLHSHDHIASWIAPLLDEGWNLIAVDDAEVIGHVGVSAKSDPDPELVISVHPEHQGRGLGTELMHQLIAYAAARGHEALTLFVTPSNEIAISIYQDTSFEIVGEQLANIEMRLSLDKPIVEKAQRPPAER